MLKNIWMNKKQRKMMGFSTVVIIVFIISLSFLLTQKGKDIVNTEVNNYLHEISQQTSYKVTQRVETNFSYLATLSNSLAYLDESAYEAYLYDAFHRSLRYGFYVHATLPSFDEKGAVYAVPYKGKDNNISAIVG